MDIIIERAILFRRLVVNDFAKKYKLRTVKNHTCLKTPSNLYSQKNYMIIHNKVLNDRYKCNLDITKYTIVFLLYKNINYSKKESDYIARLDRVSKQNMKIVFQKYQRVNCISNKVFIIGRKYTDISDKNNKTNNCFSIMCTYDIDKVILNDTLSDTLSDTISYTPSDKLDISVLSKSVLRRRFLYNLQNLVNCEVPIRKIINSGVYLDVEYTNDIYDNFEKFPISVDESILFMIGAYHCSHYYNFITDNLTQTEEHKILDNFLSILSNKFSEKDIIPLFHWSNADKYIIDKTLKRYPDLVVKYKNVISRVVFIDLLKIVKSTIPGLQSYSLKYVCKYLLNIVYDTQCKNGLDAMGSVIKNNVLLTNFENRYKSLSCFTETEDVVNYNKLDTTLLYDMIRYFLNN